MLVRYNKTLARAAHTLEKGYQKNKQPLQQTFWILINFLYLCRVS